MLEEKESEGNNRKEVYRTIAALPDLSLNLTEANNPQFIIHFDVILHWTRRS